MRPSFIVLYGTDWCPDCKRARVILTEKKIAYLDVDIETDSRAALFVEELNHGYQSTPTIIFPDGTILVEPSNEKLAARLDEYIKTL
jgi:glutaredoxin